MRHFLMLCAVISSLPHATLAQDPPANGPQPPSAQRVVPNLDGFAPQPANAFRPGSLFEILAQIDSSFPEDLPEGRPNLSINASQYGDTLAVELAETGWADDSVNGRVTRLILSRQGSLWQVGDMGTAWLCARGPLAVSAGPCP